MLLALTSHRYLTLLACFLAAPALTLASSVTVNGTCEVGSCPVPPGSGPLASGSSIPLTSFNFTYTLGNGDPYDIFGNYAAGNSAAGTTIQFNATAVYEGSSPSAADVLTIDDLQDYTVTTGLSGTYFEDTAAGFGGTPGSSLTAQLFENGQGLGVLGPFTSAGFQSKSTPLTLSGTALATDFQFSFDFASGSTKGSYITTVPEPAAVIPVAAILALGLAVPAFRRSRLISNNIG